MLTTTTATLTVLGVLLTMAPTAQPIQNLPYRPCQEYNLHLTCQCNYQNKVLNVPSLSQFNVHTSVNKITIQNCERVWLGKNILQDYRSLRNLEIINVDDLVLSQYALNWTGYELYESPSLNIILKNTTVSKVSGFAFIGSPAEIHLERSGFDFLEAFAFASLTRVLRISILNCEFKQIHAQAFKGIETYKFTINNSTFNGILTSSAFRDIDIKDIFTISNSKFGVVKPNAFIVKKPVRFEILDSYFDTLESESFSVRTKGIVIIKNNYFRNLHDRAFMGISLIKENRISANSELLFSGNKLNDLQRDSIIFNKTSFTPKYGAIFLNHTCSCVEIQVWSINNEIKEHIYCVNDTLRQTSIQAEVFKKRVCETGTKTWLILVAVFSVILVLLVIAVVVIVVLYRRYKQRKQTEFVNRGRGKTGSLGLIVPDGRTYRETEVHVIVEKAELLTTEL